jgi:outer membrane lipoprotein-sorting protein
MQNVLLNQGYGVSMKRLVTCLLAASIVLSFSGWTFSYILPAEQIIGFMIEHLGSARSVEIVQKAIIYNPELEGGMQELDGTLHYRRPDQFRSKLTGPGIEQILVVSSGGAISVANGKIVAEAESSFDHFKDPMLYRQEDLILQRLSELNIDVETVSFGRFKDKIAYVIGAKYPDESVPQLWIDKETFRPIRFVVRGRGPHSPDLEEIEYSEYTPLDKKRWYPGRILFLQNGELIKMYVLDSFRVNPALPKELFDLSHLETLYEPMAFRESSPPPPSEVDEVQKTIRDFSRTFE